MAVLLKHIKQLYKQELYSNVISVCDMIITLAEQKQNYMPTNGKLEVLMYHADSLYYLHYYNQAENFYRLALQISSRKSSLSSSSSSSSSLQSNQSAKGTTKHKSSMNEFISETNIKYKIHLCYLALKQTKNAIDILESILVRQRTPKIQMALGNLYKVNGMGQMAIACYKEVLNECPLALEAIGNLIRLGVDAIGSNSLLKEIMSDAPWLMPWINAEAQLYSKNFSDAIQTYKSMDTYGLFKDNCSLLVNMGYCYHYMSEHRQSISVLQKAVQLDPHLISGKDFLSTLLVSINLPEHQQALEKLATNTSDCMTWSPQQWIITGNLMYMQKKYDKAAKLAQQAIDNNGSINMEAAILKANSLIKLKQYTEAAVVAHEARKLCSFRYEPYKCLVDCYIATSRVREAEAVVKMAYGELNSNAHTYCLHAKLLLKEPVPFMTGIEKILKKALAKDPNGNTNALFMLAEFWQKEQDYLKAKNILLKASKTQKSSKIHEYLGDCYVHLEKYNDAFKHYTHALKLDPNNHEANEGLNNINKNLSATSSYDKREGTSNTVAEPDDDHDSDGDLWAGVDT